jgi:hypothetical protein
MPRRKKRLSQQDLRDLGASPGRLTTRYAPDGRAVVRQVVGDKSGSLFSCKAPLLQDRGRNTQPSEGG